MANLSLRQRLFARQGGLCAHCNRPLSLRLSHRHDLVPGRSEPALRVLLHPACHRKLHSRAK